MIGTIGTGNLKELPIGKIVHKSALSYCPFIFVTKEFIEVHQMVCTTWCLQDTVVHKFSVIIPDLIRGQM